MNKIQKKLLFNECLGYLTQTLLNFTTDFLSQNNLKAKYQGKNGWMHSYVFLSSSQNLQFVLYQVLKHSAAPHVLKLNTTLLLIV